MPATSDADAPPPTRAVGRSEVRWMAVAVVVGVGLLAAKFVAYALTGSSAIFTDALESIANVGASGFALWALRWAHKPADRAHPYGHGRVEFLAALLEGALILVASGMALWHVVTALIQGPDVARLQWGLAIIAGGGGRQRRAGPDARPRWAA